LIKIVYDAIKYVELSSQFVIINAFENYLKSIAFNGYIIFNNKDFAYILGGELFGIRKIEDVKRPWIANVYKLNPKVLILYMNFKDGKIIENIKISSKALNTIIKNTIEITPFFWMEIKHKEDIFDLIYFSSELISIYKNSSRIDEIIQSEFSEKIEVNVWDFKNLFETKKTEMIKILYIKRFENLWQKYKNLVILEYGKDKAEIEFRKVQKDLSKKYPILDPLLGIVDLDKEFNLKIQSLNENEIQAIIKLLEDFYSKALPKKIDKIREELL